MRHLEFWAAVVEDDRWLDGSRHVGVVGELDGSEASLYFVIDHDGALSEAELSMGLDDDSESVGFDHDQGTVNWDELEIHLKSRELQIETHGRTDGDVDVVVTFLGGEA